MSESESPPAATVAPSGKEHHKLVFDSTDVAFCVAEVLFDSEGKPVDYRIVQTNPAYNEQTGLTDPEGKTGRELVPNLEQYWIDLFGHVALTGESTHYEHHVDSMHRTFEGYAFRLRADAPLIGIRFQDVTHHRRETAELRHSEERFSTISRVTNDAIWDWNLEEGLLWWNEGLKNLFGHDPDKVNPTLDWWKEHIHPDDRKRVDASIRAAIAGRSHHWRSEYHFRRKDGSYADVADQAFIVRDTEGKAVRMLGGMADVTEAKRLTHVLQSAKEASERDRAELHAILTSMTEGVIVIDREGRIVEANPAAVATHACERYDMVGRSLDEMAAVLDLRDLQGNPIPPAQWPGARVLRGETLRGFEVRVQRRDNQHTLLACFAGAPVKNADGEVILAVCTMHDITREREAQAAAQNARAELARANTALEKRIEERTARLRETVEELEHFSYTITHDMRAPLRAMQAFGQILRDEHAERLNQIGQDFLRRIVEAASRMDHLITDALDYTKVVRSELTLEPIDPKPLLLGIIDSYPGFQPPHAEITLAETFPLVCGNRAGMTQCFSNLISNAVKFVAPGTVPRLNIRSETRGDTVRLWFEDNGIGIPSDQHERIFGMFQRLSKAYEGTGIGLALVRKVVERMDGRVGVESEPHQGSRFWMELELARPD